MLLAVLQYSIEKTEKGKMINKIVVRGNMTGEMNEYQMKKIEGREQEHKNK